MYKNIKIDKQVFFLNVDKHNKGVFTTKNSTIWESGFHVTDWSE